MDSSSPSAQARARLRPCDRQVSGSVCRYERHVRVAYVATTVRFMVKLERADGGCLGGRRR